MLRASLTFVACTFLMIVMQPAHGSQRCKRSSRREGALRQLGRAAAADRPPAAARVDRRPHGRHAEDRRLLPALLGRAHGSAVPRDPAVRHRVPVHHRPRGRPRIERHRSRSRSGRRRARSCSSSASDRASCSCSRTSRSDLSSANPLERKSVEDSFAKSVLWGFTVAAESERPRARGRDRIPAARRHRRRQRAAARQLPRRSRAQRLLHAAHEGVSEEHRDRDDADLRQRRRRRTRRRRRRTAQGRPPIGEAGGRRGGGGADAAAASSPARSRA